MSGARASLNLQSANDESAEEDFEEKAVTEEALQGDFSFGPLFSGRHTAAPELVIGPQFVLNGATFGNMVLGCLVGNILAVLAWRYVCAPIAVMKRFTTYYTVKRICGNNILAIYNVLVAMILGGIAGFMYILAANALAIGFGLIDAGAENGFVITSPGVLLITFLTGSFTTVVAMFGIKAVTFISYWLTPPMFAVIGYLIYAACVDLGIGLGNFVEVMNNRVFLGTCPEGCGLEFTLVVIILTAFVQDQFCHIGCVDLSLFRFAKTADAGWQSAWGMYLGHFFLWIGAGILFRSQVEYNVSQGVTNPNNIIPGPMAFRLGGWPGLLAILFAAWSTANPFLYAGGLALKSSLTIAGKDVPARTVTGIMGLIATVVAFFPGLVNFFLLFVQFGGAFLAPIGAIIVADTYILPKLGFESDYSFTKSHDCSTTNRAAVLAWWVSSGLTAPLIYYGVLPGIYGPFINFPMSAAIYVYETKRIRPSASA